MTRRVVLTLVLIALIVAAVAWFQRPIVLEPRFGDVLKFEIHGTKAHDELGHSVASCGDLDGDGVNDFVVDAPNADLEAYFEAGFARVYSGKHGSVIRTFGGEGREWFHGHSVDCLGDVDGDGIDDVVVGMIGDGFAGGPGGGARVFSGKSGALLFAVGGEIESDHFGSRVAAIGDADGDDVPDFAVGAPGLYTGNIVGYVRVHSGRDGKVIHRLTGQKKVGDRFGYVVAAAGDVNGDGHDDIAVGALRDDDAGPHSGALYVFSGTTGAQLLRIAGEHENDELGHDVVLTGDANGDGTRDLLVGAFARDRNSFAEIRALPSGELIHRFTSNATGDAYGHTVATVDFDRDGVLDYVVGAPDADVEEARRAGRVFVYSGKTRHLVRQLDGVRSKGHFGYALRGLGPGRLLVGSSVGGAPGAAWVFHSH